MEKNNEFEETGKQREVLNQQELMCIKYLQSSPQAPATGEIRRLVVLGELLKVDKKFICNDVSISVNKISINTICLIFFPSNT